MGSQWHGTALGEKAQQLDLASTASMNDDQSSAVLSCDQRTFDSMSQGSQLYSLPSHPKMVSNTEDAKVKDDFSVLTDQSADGNEEGTIILLLEKVLGICVYLIADERSLFDGAVPITRTKEN